MLRLAAIVALAPFALVALTGFCYLILRFMDTGD